MDTSDCFAAIRIPPSVRRRQVGEITEVNAKQGEHQVLIDYIEFSFLKAYDARMDVVYERAHCITPGLVIEAEHVP